jgi:hypothetical protein
MSRDSAPHDKVLRLEVRPEPAHINEEKERDGFVLALH